MWLFLPLLLCWGCAGGGGPEEPCWEALLRCQDEPDCGAAYSQSQAACEPVLSRAEAGSGEPPGGCPSHCIGALVRLNRSRSGPALERCECGQDARCRRLKAAIEPCLPRPSRSGLGCTAARFRCQQEPACREPLDAYLARCGQLFNGRRCSAACRAAMGQLLAAPGGPALERCVCDGPERPFCQVLKANMGRLCSAPPAEPGPDEDYRDEERLLREEDEGPGAGGAWVRSGGSSRDAPAWCALALGVLPLGLRLLSWP
ncbi:growth arrest-specific protein 1-like [Gopherus evgoodei]|uniref:growth arrest-specific protein 1-like n=1 Tax=Gopherus evgoodei TaxID=1825980 RepID=UPI0011CFC1BF|nr:growth arrest-specific protein 1-like [Gopherus evgoodei]